MAITNKLTYVGSPGNVTSLGAPGKALAATSINIGSATNWPTDAVYFTIRTVNPSSVSITNPSGFVSGTQTFWKGTLSGTTISNLQLQYGTDQVYTAGVNTQVFVSVDPFRENAIIDALLSQHDVLGGHANITATSLSVSGNITASGTLTGVTPAKMQNPYKFSVYLNVAQAIAAGASVKIAHDTKAFDTGANVDVVTTKGRFTAPVAGFYQFNAAVNFGAINGNTGGSISLYKNGVQALAGTALEIGTSTFTPCFVVGGMLSLNATDYVEVFYTNNDSLSRNANAGQALTYFHGFMVSAT